MIVAGIIGIALLAFVAYVYFTFRKMKNAPMVADGAKIKVLTDKNFNQQIKKGVMLVDFWAAWCGPCKMMAPILNDLSEELDGNNSIGKLNVEQYQSVSASYQVRGIPTMILFKDGKEINRFVGIKTKAFLLREITKIS